MFNIGLTADPSGLTEQEIRKELTSLLPSAVVRAQRNAINRTITAMRTHISKRVREDKALKASTVKDSLSIKRAGRGANPVGEVDVKPKPLSLKRYGARTTRKGVTVKVSKQTGRTTVKGGFIPPSLGGHTYKRVGGPRLPIKKLFGPSVRIEVEQHRDDIDRFRKRTFERRLRNQVNWEITKVRR